MSTLTTKENREAMLQAVSKRPQTKFAKLFHEMDSKPSQKNIVLVLMELAEQKDFYVDFNISLQYFLDLYQKLDAASKGFLFNEAGLLIFNATRVYDRRLDCVLQRVEAQLASLSSSQETQDNNKTEDATASSINEKPKRTRKRLIETTTDPYEVELSSRKFKKISESKRLAMGTQLDRFNMYAEQLHVENYLHPALWKYAELIDLENEEDIDSKRNYRLFTTHLEHRYNTLMPDINFRLYFKMKDFLDEEDERDEENDAEVWPPLSQAFIKRYIDLEDQALALEQTPSKKRRLESPTCDILELNDVNCKSANIFGSQISNTGLRDSGIGLSLSSNSDESNKCITADNVDKLQINSTLTTSPEDIENINELSGDVTNGNGKVLNGTLQESSNENELKTQTVSELGTSLEDSSILNANLESSVKNTNEKEVSKQTETSTPLDSSNETGFQTESALGNSLENSAALNSTLENDGEKETNSIIRNSSEIELNQERNMEISILDESVVNEIASSAVINSTQVEELAISSNVTENDTPGSAAKVSSTVIEDKTPETVENQSSENRDREEETVELIVQIETSDNNVSKNNDFCEQLSPQNDEGICFSDIDDAPLTPITIHVDKSVLNGFEQNVDMNLNNLEKFTIVDTQPNECWPIKWNILEFPKEVIKKMRRKHLLTDLGEDMELFLRARHYKRSRTTAPEITIRQFKASYFERCSSSVSDVYNTPPPSPSDSVFLGFTGKGVPLSRLFTSGDDIEVEKPIKNCGIGVNYPRLSRDSGVENDLLTATPEKNSSFFHPIIDEELNEKVDSPANEDNLFGVNQSSNIEILEDILLQTATTNESNIEENQIDNPNEKESENESLKQNEEVQNETAQSSKDQSNIENINEIIEKESETIQDNMSKTENFDETSNENNTDNFKGITNINLNEVIETSTLNNDDKHLNLSDDTVAKIQLWHRHLQPILAHSRERHHFDVFQIGTNIINEFSVKANDADIVTLQDVMKFQDPSYVSRYFLSSLLLANQGNLELKLKNKCEDKPSDWCDVHFKLLSTNRHVVSVEDNIGMLPVTKNLIDKSLQASSRKDKSKPSIKLKNNTPVKSIEIITTTGTTTPTSNISPQLLPPQAPAPSRKRNGNYAAVTASNVNLYNIEIIKPIGKTPRMSQSEDSGFSSLGEVVDVS